MGTESQQRKFVAEQIKNAFAFMQKLYNESAFLIKEIEAHLAETDYRFTILKPSGYGISSRSSSGLEPNNVKFWLLRKFAVAFVEEDITELKKGQTHTEIDDDLKVLYFRIILDDPNEEEPQLMFGVFYDIKLMKNGEPIKNEAGKFERLMGAFEYKDDKIFSNIPTIDWEDKGLKIKGNFLKVSLLSINNSQELNEKVIQPILNLYKSLP